MIRVDVTKNKHLITISGHASYLEYGKDIVCASVSSIAITSINAMLRFDSNSIKYEDKDGYIKVEVLKDTKETLVLLDNMIELLHQLEKQYSKNISIKIK